MKYTFSEYRAREKKNEKLRLDLVDAYDMVKKLIQAEMTVTTQAETHSEMKKHYDNVIKGIDSNLAKLNLYVEQNLPLLVKEQYALGQYWAALNLQSEYGINVTRQPDSFSKIDEYAIRSVLEETFHALDSARAGVLSNSRAIINNELNNAVLQNLISGESMKTASDKLAERFISKGLDSITMKNGRSMDILHYARTKLHTATMKAHNKGTELLMLEDGFCYVTYSDHKTSCSKCNAVVKKGGKRNIYSIDPRVTTLPDGTPVKSITELPNGGEYIHENCRHVKKPFIPEYEDISNFNTLKENDEEKKEDA
ncbi:phage minor capsid protein [Lysinibacillus sp. FSL K6-0075]|uniref:phage minor capsid protein n=1 Tax=Lysinibacillus sp. FSL K6-0075 TaxID=2921415 RepID=UPI0031592BC3